MFSISAIAMTVRSSSSRTTTGTSSRPASCEARQRRSPATISKLSGPSWRTRIGWITPCALIDSASSASLVSSMSRRGWYLPGCR